MAGAARPALGFPSFSEADRGQRVSEEVIFPGRGGGGEEWGSQGIDTRRVGIVSPPQIIQRFMAS